MTGVLVRDQDRHTQRDDCVGTQGEDGHLHAQERGLGVDQPCGQLWSLTPDPRMGTMRVCGSAPICSALLGQPETTHTGATLPCLSVPTTSWPISPLPSKLKGTSYKTPLRGNPCPQWALGEPCFRVSQCPPWPPRAPLSSEVSRSLGHHLPPPPTNWCVFYPGPVPKTLGPTHSAGPQGDTSCCW